MKIRKRSLSMAPAATPQQPISYKYQQRTCTPREGRASSSVIRAQLEGRTVTVAECSNMQDGMQENRCLDDDDDHEAPAAVPPSRSDLNALEPPATELAAGEARDVKDESGPLDDDAITDKGRCKHSSSLTKRRKIEHDSSLNILEGPSSMTAAELLAVNELANGVRQRLAASEFSTSEQEKPPPARSSSKPAENSKDALISSIFCVFDTYGDHGLSASEVVKQMIDQRLPGLKEGGARHTVQVANVLRSSSSFFSLGDKKYLLCAAVDTGSRSIRHTRATTTTTHAGDDDTGSENELARPTKRRSGGTKLGTKCIPKCIPKKVQAEPPKDVLSTGELKPELKAVNGEAVVVARVARRRGPSSSQKGKGPTQCKRYDGRGWQCSRLTEPGYSLCVHHQDLINKRAAKLKEQQTLSRLMESVQRKAKSSQQAPIPAPAANDQIRNSKDLPCKSDAEAPVQKRKMLSLLAINK